MKSPRLIAIPLSGLLWLTVSGARAENWPRFRGPNGSGLSADVTIPAQWTDADFRWRIDLPGMGHGSPVVWGDKLFLLCATEPAPKAKGKAKGKKKAAEAAAASSPDGDATPPAPQRWMPICLSTKDGSILWK